MLPILVIINQHVRCSFFRVSKKKKKRNKDKRRKRKNKYKRVAFEDRC